MKELELCQEVARVDRVVAVLPETFGDHPFPLRSALDRLAMASIAFIIRFRMTC